MAYTVTLLSGDDVLGGGFFMTHRFVVTAAHCLRSLGEGKRDVRVKVDGSSTAPLAGVVLDVNSHLDLALVHVVPGDVVVTPPIPDTCFRGDSWRSPYRPSLDDPVLAGDVIEGSVDYKCAGGSVIDALQLHTDVELGDYSGYSGGPIERTLGVDMPTLVGVMLEQYPNRAIADIYTDVLFAATMAVAMECFPELAPHNLLAALDRHADQSDHTPSQAQQDTANIGKERLRQRESQSNDSVDAEIHQMAAQIRIADMKLRAYRSWVAEGLLEVEDARVAQALVSRRVADMGSLEREYEH